MTKVTLVKTNRQNKQSLHKCKISITLIETENRGERELHLL